MTNPHRRKPDPTADRVGQTGDEAIEPAPDADDAELTADFSLATLGRLYAQAVAQHKGERPAGEELVEPAASEPVGSGQASRLAAPDSVAASTSRPARSRPPRVGPPGGESRGAESPAVVRVDPVPVTPATILEAILFVGSPDNAPLTARKAASLIRGVSPQEVNELVSELNRQYAACHAAYQIVGSEQGYRLVLRDDLQTVCARLRGQERPARLSPAAIEVLAVVAYHQPVSGEEVDRLRSHQSGAILSQLARRGLLALQRDPHNPRVRRFVTTERFLDLYGLDSLADLPQADFDDLDSSP